MRPHGTPWPAAVVLPPGLPAAADPVRAASAAPAFGRQRRRLWHLPPQAHELLLATSFSPDELRRDAARTLGQMHHGVCKLQGSDVDLLYSLVGDLGSRNPQSEALQKRLDQRHCHSLRRLAALREPQALQAAWTQALASDQMAAVLWALLTHPQGAALEALALYDARGWVFAHCRRSLACVQAQSASGEGELLTRQRVDQLQQRLVVQQHQAAAALEQAQLELARLRGEVARLRTPSAGAMPAVLDAPAAPTETTETTETTAPTRPAAPTRTAPQASPARPFHPEPACNAAAAVNVRRAHGPAAPRQVPAATSAPRAVPRGSHPVQGRRVLCVGGIQHAVAHYRARIEGMGGLFEHHDGGLQDSVQGLDGRLHRAEVVICQAGCINHEAYQRIKRHCERTGTPCMYLDGPACRDLHEPCTNWACRRGGGSQSMAAEHGHVATLARRPRHEQVSAALPVRHSRLAVRHDSVLDACRRHARRQARCHDALAAAAALALSCLVFWLLPLPPRVAAADAAAPVTAVCRICAQV